jgi:hypothetical protein
MLLEFLFLIVTCYLLTRRIILWVADFVSRFIGYYIRRRLQSLVATIPPLFRLPGYLAYRTVGSNLVLSVAWHWLFSTLDNSAFQTTCHIIKITVLEYDMMTSCNMVDIYHCSRGICYLILQVEDDSI